jgi:hypothetical protein
MLGPGPLLTRYRLAGYEVLFRDSVNRATHPGILSVELQRRNRTVNDARVAVAYRSLDMRMQVRTLPLASRGAGRYSRPGPQLRMGGRWRITITVQPQRGPELQLSLTDLIPE